MAKYRTVELIQAFVWTCDECGRDNFERGVSLSPESIAIDQLPDAMDAETFQAWTQAGGEGAFMTAPSRVTCPHCNSQFDTETELQTVNDEFDAPND